MKPRSVCMITGSYPPRTCGIADYTRRLVASLTDAGNSVTVVTPTHGDAEPWAMVSVGGKWNLRTLREVVRRMRELKPDVVHLQYQAGIYGGRAEICLLPLALRLMTGSRVVTTFHDLNGPPRWGRLHRLGVLLALAGSHGKVVCSGKQMAGLKRLPVLGRNAAQIPVGPNVCPSADLPAPDRSQSDVITVLYFGFIWRNRGLESVVTAVANAAEQGYEIRVVFAGGIIDETHPDELRRQASELGLRDDQVVFTGTLATEELREVMQSSSFCILPFPTGVSTGRGTFASCAASGLAVITTYDAANCPRELRHEDNVLLYEYGNEARLSELVLLLCSNPEMRVRLGRRMRETSGYLDWRNIAGEHEKLYAQV